MEDDGWENEDRSPGWEYWYLYGLNIGWQDQQYWRESGDGWRDRYWLSEGEKYLEQEERVLEEMRFEK